MSTYLITGPDGWIIELSKIEANHRGLHDTMAHSALKVNLRY